MVEIATVVREVRMNKKGKIRVLFLCTGNSCRSQMAEGWARHLKSDTVEAFSAGIEVHGLNPYAVRVMALPFDYVVTVCGDADRRCPFFPGEAQVVHRGFDDPPQLAQHAATEEEILAPYRRVRDEIRTFVEGLPQTLIGPFEGSTDDSRPRSSEDGQTPSGT